MEAPKRLGWGLLGGQQGLRGSHGQAEAPSLRLARCAWEFVGLGMGKGRPGFA